MLKLENEFSRRFHGSLGGTFSSTFSYNTSFSEFFLTRTNSACSQTEFEFHLPQETFPRIFGFTFNVVSSVKNFHSHKRKEFRFYYSRIHTFHYSVICVIIRRNVDRQYIFKSLKQSVSTVASTRSIFAGVC